MRKILLPITILLTLSAFLSACTGSISASTNNALRTIDVTGIGKVDIKPDLARVNIGVRSQSPEIVEAYDENSEIARNIIQSLIDMGVAQEDIQTFNFNIYQQQEPNREPDAEPTTSYVVENTVAVVVRNLDSLGEILSTMISKGANTIQGVNFDVENREAAIVEARQLAIEDAKAQAEAIAETAGVKLGEIRNISIGQNGSIMPRAAYAEEAAMGGGEVPISSGTMIVQVTANLRYDIK